MSSRTELIALLEEILPRVEFYAHTRPFFRPPNSNFLNAEGYRNEYERVKSDALWERLTSDSGEESQCGWLIDRFGVSWQIVPIALGEMLTSDDTAAVERVTGAFMKMTKLDIANLEKAFRNE